MTMSSTCSLHAVFIPSPRSRFSVSSVSLIARRRGGANIDTSFSLLSVSSPALRYAKKLQMSAAPASVSTADAPPSSSTKAMNLSMSRLPEPMPDIPRSSAWLFTPFSDLKVSTAAAIRACSATSAVSSAAWDRGSTGGAAAAGAAAAAPPPPLHFSCADVTMLLIVWMVDLQFISRLWRSRYSSEFFTRSTKADWPISRAFSTTVPAAPLIAGMALATASSVARTRSKTTASAALGSWRSGAAACSAATTSASAACTSSKAVFARQYDHWSSWIVDSSHGKCSAVTPVAPSPRSSRIQPRCSSVSSKSCSFLASSTMSSMERRPSPSLSYFVNVSPVASGSASALPPDSASLAFASSLAAATFARSFSMTCLHAPRRSWRAVKSGEFFICTASGEPPISLAFSTTFAADSLMRATAAPMAFSVASATVSASLGARAAAAPSATDASMMGSATPATSATLASASSTSSDAACASASTSDIIWPLSAASEAASCRGCWVCPACGAAFSSGGSAAKRVCTCFTARRISSRTFAASSPIIARFSCSEAWSSLCSSS
mmetsp:Transcript_117982/g.334616  ORF Transcript_117982/g.334616 Transcript_117982/m.334616 type:complete len:553 (+) Transcript_117982:208-1866(+)